MDILSVFDKIATFIAVVYVGVVGTFFNKKAIELMVKLCLFLYKKTNFSFFKIGAVEMVKSYFKIMFFLFGILGFILGINFIIQNIFGIGLPISWK